MKHRMVTGAGGVRLHVVEAGDSSAQPILFVHGWSQSHLSWTRQLKSGLADSFRLVALDLRGHGDSEKPGEDAYADSRLWADDIQAVIDALSLQKPVLCAWSYGGYVVNDFLRHRGQSSVAAINYVGAATDMGIAMSYKFLGAGWNGILPGPAETAAGTVFSEDAEEASIAMRSFVGNCFARALALEEEMAMLGSNLLCPPRVRLALFSRQMANDDVLGQIHVPVLVTHGSADAIVDIETGRHIVSKVARSTISVYASGGHGVFWEEPDRFNTELAALAASAVNAEQGARTEVS